MMPRGGRQKAAPSEDPRHALPFDIFAACGAAAKHERNDSDVSSFGAAVKGSVNHEATDITTDAVSFCDGASHVKGYRVGRIVRGARITQIYEVTNQIQPSAMARHPLRDPAARV